MHLHRARGNVQLSSDFFVGRTAGCNFEHLEFTVAESFFIRRRGIGLGCKTPQNFLGYAGMQHAFAACHRPHCVHDFVVPGVLEQISGGSSLEQREHVSVVVVTGQHQHRHGGLNSFNLSGGFDTVHIGHRNVHQNQVWLETL